MLLKLSDAPNQSRAFEIGLGSGEKAVRGTQQNSGSAQ